VYRKAKAVSIGVRTRTVLAFEIIARETQKWVRTKIERRIGVENKRMCAYFRNSQPRYLRRQLILRGGI
jgi:hypothetical protein